MVGCLSRAPPPLYLPGPPPTGTQETGVVTPLIHTDRGAPTHTHTGGAGWHACGRGGCGGIHCVGCGRMVESRARREARSERERGLRVVPPGTTHCSAPNTRQRTRAGCTRWHTRIYRVNTSACGVCRPLPASHTSCCMRNPHSAAPCRLQRRRRVPSVEQQLQFENLGALKAVAGRGASAAENLKEGACNRISLVFAAARCHPWRV